MGGLGDGQITTRIQSSKVRAGMTGRACALCLAAALIGWPAAASGADDAALRDRPTFNLQLAHAVFLAQSDAADPAAGEILFDEEDLMAVEDDEGLSDLLDENEQEEINDPLEGFNRPVFGFNLFLDRWILRPVTRIYRETIPQPGRDGIANAIDNVNSPVTFVNDILQGEMSRAGTTLGRFFINSFFGLAGLFDTAAAMGLPGHEEDFGQTLGAYGVGDSPFIMLPVIGPTNPRDMVGKAADIASDPQTWVLPAGLARIKTGVELVSDREQILDETDALEATSVDYYAAVRSLYVQNRRFEISNEGEGKQRDPEGFMRRPREN